MNVMKQDVIDEKITERCKTCEKQCMQEDLDRLRSYWAKANLDGLNSYQASIEQTKAFSIDRESIEHPESFSMDQAAIENVIKSSWRGSIDSLAVERCPSAVEIA